MIYFIQAQTQPYLIKIGFTAELDVSVRFETLRQMNAVDLVLLLVISGTQSNEFDLHKQFSDERVRGEWFLPSNRILSFLLKKIDEKNHALLLKSDEKNKSIKHNFNELNNLVNEKNELNKLINKLLDEKIKTEKVYSKKLNKLLEKIKVLQEENKQLWLEKINKKELLVTEKSLGMERFGKRFSAYCQPILNRMYNAENINL